MTIAEGWLIGMKLEAIASPQVREAMRLWAMGEDAETAAKKAGVPDTVMVVFLAVLSGVSDDKGTRAGILEVLARCKTCGASQDSADKFCVFCGSENSLFDETAYTQSMSNTFAEDVRLNCDKDHPDKADHEKDDPERKTPFCALCGKKLY